MTKEQIEFWHRKSLILADMFKEAYSKRGKGDLLADLLLEKYIQARQMIPKEYGRRHGSNEAYLATQ